MTPEEIIGNELITIDGYEINITPRQILEKFPLTCKDIVSYWVGIDLFVLNIICTEKQTWQEWIVRKMAEDFHHLGLYFDFYKIEWGNPNIIVESELDVILKAFEIREKELEQ